MSEAIDRTLRDGTYDAIWCPLCDMFATGPWPVGVVAMHECREVAS